MIKGIASFIRLVIAGAALSALSSATAKPTSPTLVYLDESRLATVKAHPERFAAAIKAVTLQADASLKHPLDPVTNKTQLPASGDVHDYFSLGPYWWPNPTTPTGLPWVVRDGEVNPRTRGPHTDQRRTARLWADTHVLGTAYAVTGKRAYADRLAELLTVWFIDPATRVNPNVDHGQAVPGVNDGRAAGLIEWDGISNVVTAAQLLKRDGIWDAAHQQAMDTWLRDYLRWLKTSDIGREEESLLNNHGSWYDFQAIGLMLYLGDDRAARDQAELAKTRRIAQQIDREGRQTAELARTKSINYSAMNALALTLDADLARRVGIDLFGYTSPKGAGLPQAIGFLAPYANGAGGWPYRQITPGGVDAAIRQKLWPRLAMIEVLTGCNWLNAATRSKARAQLGAAERIAYAIPDDGQGAQIIAKAQRESDEGVKD